MIEKLPFFFESLRSAYQKGLDPIELIEEVYRRITRVNDPGIFINLREKEEVKHEAAKLSEKKVLNKENFDQKAQSEFLKGAKIAYETIIHRTNLITMLINFN